MQLSTKPRRIAAFSEVHENNKGRVIKGLVANQCENKRPPEDLNATPNKTHVSNPGIKLFNSVSDVRLFLRQHLPRDLLLYTSTAGCQKGAKKMFEYGSERPFRCT